MFGCQKGQSPDMFVENVNKKIQSTVGATRKNIFHEYKHFFKL
jgi:hypothetical protein